LIVGRDNRLRAPRLRTELGWMQQELAPVTVNCAAPATR
jgi:hypothetical protein